MGIDYMPEVFHDFLFPVSRLDWFGAGSSSPNKTGTFLAILFILSWWPFLRFRHGFWISVPLSFICGILLVQTASRGAIVALVMGLISLLFFSRPWKLGRKRIAVCIVSLVLLFSYAHRMGIGDRFAGMAAGNDGSANVRVELYSAGLRMIASAPFGWGHGLAADIYEQWYQNLGDDRTYLSLVNSHLTWMAEYGLVFQLAYIFAWIFILLICFPGSLTPLRTTAFSCWIALGVGAAFSSVLTMLWLWFIPLILLLISIIQRLLDEKWPEKKQWIMATISVFVIFFCLHGVARAMSGEPDISYSSGCVRIGNNLRGLLLLEPDSHVLGERYGHTIRTHLDAIGSVSVLTDTNLLDRVFLSEYSCIALSGDIADMDFLNEYSGLVILLNPRIGTNPMVAEELAECRLRVVVGGMGDWRRLRKWKKLSVLNPDWEIIVVPDAAEYIPDWINYCMEQEI